MGYEDKFVHADGVVEHLNSVVPAITDPLLQRKYVGFVSIVAVTVYELAIKEIFIDFSHKKHKILGNFTESFFDRINGRIKMEVVQKDYIPKFGVRYTEKFKRNIKSSKVVYLRDHGRDFCTSYNNIITWRNQFAHEGIINSHTTYDDAVRTYEDGKQVIHCLAASMAR